MIKESTVVWTVQGAERIVYLAEEVDMEGADLQVREPVEFIQIRIIKISNSLRRVVLVLDIDLELVANRTSIM
jgi:hypothetical protein